MHQSKSNQDKASKNLKVTVHLKKKKDCKSWRWLIGPSRNCRDRMEVNTALALICGRSQHCIWSSHHPLRSWGTIIVVQNSTMRSQAQKRGTFLLWRRLCSPLNTYHLSLSLFLSLPSHSFKYISLNLTILFH